MQKLPNQKAYNKLKRYASTQKMVVWFPSRKVEILGYLKHANISLKYKKHLHKQGVRVVAYNIATGKCNPIFPLTKNETPRLFNYRLMNKDEPVSLGLTDILLPRKKRPLTEWNKIVLARWVSVIKNKFWGREKQ